MNPTLSVVNDYLKAFRGVKMLYTLLLLAFVLHSNAVQLTLENYKEETKGKSVFIQFSTTWCEHCKEIQPEWVKLAELYKDSPNVVIATVQCNGDGKAFCDSESVSTYPIVKYGIPGTLHTYKGEHTVSDWNATVSKLKKPCDVYTLEHCTPNELKFIKRVAKMDDIGFYKHIGELKELLAGFDKVLSKKIKKAEKMYKDAIEEHDKSFDDAQEEYPVHLFNAISSQKAELRELVMNTMQPKKPKSEM